MQTEQQGKRTVVKTDELVHITWPNGEVTEAPFKLDYPRYLSRDHYIWEKPVTQTRSTSFHDRTARFYSDCRDNNFGIADLVLFNPRIIHPYSKKPVQEGQVLEIHQYVAVEDNEFVTSWQDRTFGIRVDFGENGVAFHPSGHLKALTNEHVVFENQDRFPTLKDVPFRDFANAGNAVKELFEDPVARAIWMSYRIRHISSEGDINTLNASALRLSAHLQEYPMDRNRIAIWFKDNMRPEVDEQFAIKIVPFLLGEKVATSIPQ